MRLSYYIPLRIVSAANKREHWRAKAVRVADEKAMISFYICFLRRERVEFPCTVTMTRIAPRMLDDDNLVSGFKAVRDQIARMIGIDDRDPRVKWVCAQEKGEPKQYACRIVIEGST